MGDWWAHLFLRNLLLVLKPATIYCVFIINSIVPLRTMAFFSGLEGSPAQLFPVRYNCSGSWRGSHSQHGGRESKGVAPIRTHAVVMDSSHHHLLPFSAKRMWTPHHHHHTNVTFFHKLVSHKWKRTIVQDALKASSTKTWFAPAPPDLLKSTPLNSSEINWSTDCIPRGINPGMRCSASTYGCVEVSTDFWPHNVDDIWPKDLMCYVPGAP